ncbi:4-hydroxy-tetrahydrodipicolinate reductase [Wohlfahrtiimonas chitiniclastica]|uniref:4-hydroxy-tetrahydrodipicolinate reductase n=1 Tax=Wohlfahrtiimonas chitiniclastica TaxID=400946 RepID=UPI001BD1345B|nr:4-hydroxy-tetrahydrodipicolinate reductase [Wohlfahrtiimonas chitiniclastica]MBS7816359.1 4-hydroxy-tetrahydrodipicolinate reductase [Wohlfahrtiimonas chitiniclastica]MBS7821646.1 4-hydroxy-tetrahydrodipicolinate reductase [Wohlfahrtiimonas chitiniclastica]MBS7829438.1 4-hydroxy-tetrahydrodipicolinate reductase [Wohlfahrtiimonas chitiniclastica]MBS7831405.1 4-hydroxy-tetrahydrodipicolinate reductase [Wohlfahrtiimonas chitiniclastica]
MIRIGIIGVEGRMGLNILQLVTAAEDLTLGAAITHHGSPNIGQDAGSLLHSEPLNVRITDDVASTTKDVDVYIDFTLPEATMINIQPIANAHIPVVIGTTGLSAEDLAQLAIYAKETAILQAPNMSLGVNLVYALLEQAAKVLGKQADIEVLEMHHRFKKDAPSGTALQMGKVVAHAMNEDFDKIAVYDRHDMNRERGAGEIGFATLRGGSVVGDHTVIFATLKEQIEITHKAKDRSLFADGAVYAARWLHQKPHGLYSMQDTLAL